MSELRDYNNDSDYRRIHRLLRKKRGPASGYVCVSCEDPAHHWAYQSPDNTDSTWYSDDMDDYVPMCTSCHKKLDWSRRPDLDRATRMERARAVRRVCVECRMTSTAAGIGVHQKASGHIGYEEV